METNEAGAGGAGGKRAKPDVTRKRGRKRNWQKAFLAAFAQIGIVAPAAAAAGVSRNAVRLATLRDPAFAAKYAEALETSTERLEGMAYARAIRAESPSDLLMIFLLKARRPKVYRDNYRLEHTGPDGGSVAPVVATQGAVILLPQDGFEEIAARYASGAIDPAQPRAAV